MTKEELRITVEAELTLGKAAKDVAEQHNLPYVTVVGWRKKLAERNREANASDVVNVDPEVLHMVANRLKDEAPPSVAKQIDAVVDGATGMKSLEPKFQAVVLNLLIRAEELSKDSELTIRDWKMLGEGISALYTGIFNKSGVSVNVQNNTQVSSEKMSLFKSSMSK